MQYYMYQNRTPKLEKYRTTEKKLSFIVVADIYMINAHTDTKALVFG